MKGGCERRHSPHNNSPGATESAYEPDSRSPHTEQSPPAIGRIAERQSSQTGKREMLTRGWWQISQSEGNNVANKAAATPLAPETKQETNRLSRFTLVSGDRFWVPLLLKTILPRPTDASGARIGRILFSIAMPHPERNDAQLPLIGITFKINSRIPSCVRTLLKHPTYKSVIVPKVYDSNISGSAPFENGFAGMHGHLRILLAAVVMFIIGLWSLLSRRHALWPYLPPEIYRVMGIVCLGASGFFVYLFLIR